MLPSAQKHAGNGTVLCDRDEQIFIALPAKCSILFKQLMTSQVCSYFVFFHQLVVAFSALTLKNRGLSMMQMASML